MSPIVPVTPRLPVVRPPVVDAPVHVPVPVGNRVHPEIEFPNNFPKQNPKSLNPGEELPIGSSRTLQSSSLSKATQERNLEIASQVIDAVCGKLAGDALEAINEPDETLVGKLLSDAISEALNEQLKTTQPQTRAKVMRGSCVSGAVSSGIEWSVHQVLGATTTGLNQGGAAALFTTTCQDKTHCTASRYQTRIEVVLTSPGVDAQPPLQPASLVRRDLPVVTSSAGSLCNPSFKEDEDDSLSL
ncbi:unnamed protein product [Mucor hiemalis]